MTDYCHEHSSPIPAWRMSDPVANDAGCRLCGLARWEHHMEPHCWVRPHGPRNEWIFDVTRHSALLDRTDDPWRDRPDEANAHDPAEVCEAAGFTSRVRILDSEPYPTVITKTSLDDWLAAASVLRTNVDPDEVALFRHQRKARHLIKRHRAMLDGLGRTA